MEELMFKLQLNSEKLINTARSVPKLKQKLIVFFFLSAATAFASRRVTTSKSNNLDLPGVSKQTRTNPTNDTNSSQKCYFPNSWDKLLDPNQKEFWHEGNHVPDAGFLRWATDPTIENAKLYLRRMNAKRDRLHLMAKQQEQANKELIAQGIIANDYNFKVNSKNSPKSTKKQQANNIAIQSGTHIWLYFHPACHHCKRQAQVLAGNSNVFPVQIGGETLHEFKGLNQTTWAEKEDLERYVADGDVPVLILYNKDTNKIISLKGFQPPESINKALVVIASQDS